MEDVWTVTLSKEVAAERISRVRQAKQRDKDRAKRNEARRNSSDRISREDLKKAQDGRVGAQIRFVGFDALKQQLEQDEAAKAETVAAEPATPQPEETQEQQPKKKSSVLDRLGY